MLGIANYTGNLAGYWQADLHETGVPILLVPRCLKYDLSCTSFFDDIHVGLTVPHHALQFASSRFGMAIH